MIYTPSPREQFYLTLIGAVCFGIAGLSWPLGAPTWLPIVSAIAGVIATALHEVPSIAARLPASILNQPATPPPPITTVSGAPSTATATTPVSINPSPTPHKTWNPITQTFE